MSNMPLFILDTLLLPFTLLRIFFIYLFGSRYNIDGLGFLDVMMHANNKYFNKCNEVSSNVDEIDIKHFIKNECNEIIKDINNIVDKSTTRKSSVQCITDEYDSDDSMSSSDLEDDVDKQTEKFMEGLDH
jgi:hypothetical protein